MICSWERLNLKLPWKACWTQSKGLGKTDNLWKAAAPISETEKIYIKYKKAIKIHTTSNCFHRDGSSYLYIIKRKWKGKMVNWPFADGIVFNPNYRVLLRTCRLEKSDKSPSNATVNLRLYACINKKGIRALWSGST